MTFRQAHEFKSAVELLLPLGLSEFHHGDCIGADDEAATIVHFLAPNVKIHAHPCTYTGMRANNPFTDIEHPVDTPFSRNRTIVKTCENMIGISWTEEESPKGGTWYTINYAKKLRRNLFIIFPDRGEHFRYKDS